MLTTHQPHPLAVGRLMLMRQRVRQQLDRVAMLSDFEEGASLAALLLKDVEGAVNELLELRREHEQPWADTQIEMPSGYGEVDVEELYFPGSPELAMQLMSATPLR